MTIYTKPRLRLTPAEERAADVMEWVHDRLWWDLAQMTPDGAVVSTALVTRSRFVDSPHGGLEDMGPNSSLAAIALLESVANHPEWSVLEADDPMRLDMHDDEGDR